MALGAVKSFQGQYKILVLRFIFISQHLAWPCVTHPHHHLHCNLSSPHLLKERRSEPSPGKQRFANIFTEEKVSFLSEGELNLSRSWFSRNTWWSAIKSWIPWLPHSFLADQVIYCSVKKIYCILKLKLLDQNKIIENVLTRFSLLVSHISFLVSILILKQKILKFTYLMLFQIKTKHGSHFPW